MKKKVVFETERLLVRHLEASDTDAYFDLMGNPKVMNPIPLQEMTREESDKHLQVFMGLNALNSDKNIWAVDQKDGSKFIGICALLKNNENENELAYRIRESFWLKGYGKEIAKNLIKYCFEELNYELITADVDILNLKSDKILSKLMIPVEEFYNQKEQCTDRRYKLEKKLWLKQHTGKSNIS